MILKVVNLKLRLQESQRKKMVLNPMINAAIVINLGIGKIVAHNIKEGLEMIEMIEEDVDLVQIQAPLQAIDISNIVF
jgi:hypothetical protein